MSTSRLRILAFIIVMIALSVRTHAQSNDVISYPLAPHLNAAEGTIEFWLRLETEPDGEQKHYFPIFSIARPGEVNPRVRFAYQTIWSPKWFHFFFSSAGTMLGKVSQNPYVTSADEAQVTTKADRGADRYPRVPRLKKGEWHHIAVCWQGLPQSTVMMYFDGRLVIRPIALQAALWEDLESFVLAIPFTVHDTMSIDDLRISSVVRSEAEIQETFTSGTTKADRFTLLLDRFELIETQGDKSFTVAEVFAKGLNQPGGAVNNLKQATLVEGKNGKALKIVYK